MVSSFFPYHLSDKIYRNLTRHGWLCVLLFVCGYGFAQSFATDVERAKSGDAVAQFRVGMKYDTGDEVVIDRNQALYWYQQSARQGYAPAQYHLALLYDRGESVPRQPELAALWYDRAARQNHAMAQYQLGNLYARGDGVPHNLVYSSYWYLKAAENNFPPAQYAIAISYLQGRGVIEDIQRGHFWIMVAIYSNDPRIPEFAKQLQEIAAGGLEKPIIEQNEKAAQQWLKDHEKT